MLCKGASADENNFTLLPRIYRIDDFQSIDNIPADSYFLVYCHWDEWRSAMCVYWERLRLWSPIATRYC